MDAGLEVTAVRDNPILDRVIGGLVFLAAFAIIYWIATLCGWRPDTQP